MITMASIIATHSIGCFFAALRAAFFADLRAALAADFFTLLMFLFCSDISVIIPFLSKLRNWI